MSADPHTLPAALLAALERTLGASAVDPSPSARQLAGQDVFTDEESRYPLAVLTPKTAESLAAAMPHLASHAIAVAPRGGGMSYTEGFLPLQPHVTIDLRQLNRIRRVSAEDLLIVAEAGCTWEQIAEHLARENLVPAVKPPISGSVSTLGGAAAQTLPSGMEHFLGLELVLADGSMIHTGALAQGDAPLPLRSFGPDITGLFLGDCGAFGIKTAVALRLRRKPAAQAFASFAFETMGSITKAMLALQASGMPLSLLGLDRVDRQGSASMSWQEKAQTARAMFAAGGLSSSKLLDLARGLTAERTLARARFSLHAAIESINDAHTRTVERRVTALALREGGASIPATLPQALAAKPFSIRGILGRDGERWTPVHGIFSPSRALAAIATVEDFFDTHAPMMDSHGITRSFLFSAAPNSFLIEPMFYWRDEIPVLHRAVLPARTIAKFENRTASFETRRAVKDLRLALAKRFDELGAAKCQLGRTYAYGARLTPPTFALAQTLKRALDPQNLMNPGVLGLGNSPCEL